VIGSQTQPLVESPLDPSKHSTHVLLKTT